MKPLKLIAFTAIITVIGAGPVPAFETVPGTTPKVVLASGELTATTAFNVKAVDAAGNVLPERKLTFVGQAGSTVVTAPQLLRITFNDNSSGFQAILISTNNRNTQAVPRFSPNFRLGTGAGIVGLSEKATSETGHGAVAGDLISSAPLQWTVFGVLSAANDYVMTGNSAQEFYVVDKQQAKATELDIDPQTPGVQPPPPFDTPDVLGFASVVYGISGKTATLAKAPYQGERITTNGQVFVKVAVNYTDQVGQQYGSNTINLELVTL